MFVIAYLRWLLLLLLSDRKGQKQPCLLFRYLFTQIFGFSLQVVVVQKDLFFNSFISERSQAFSDNLKA